MTLPPCMKSRIALFEMNSTSLEASAVSTLANKFTYRLIPQDDGVDACAFTETDTCNVIITNKRPFTPPALEDNRMVSFVSPSEPSPPPAKKARASPRSNKTALTGTTSIDPDALTGTTTSNDVMVTNKRPFTPPDLNEPSEASPPSDKKARASPSPNKTSSSCLLPTKKDPMDESFCKTLYSEKDIGKVNPVHLIIRRDLLEVRRTISRRIFFQCAKCKEDPRCKRAKRSTLAPQSIGNLYRLIIHFMMDHVPFCEHIPEEIKSMSAKTSKVAAMREVRKYWFTSAKKMGLKDGDDGKSIIYCGEI